MYKKDKPDYMLKTKEKKPRVFEKQANILYV